MNTGDAVRAPEAVRSYGNWACAKYLTAEEWSIATVSAALARCSQTVLERAGLDQASRLRFFVLAPSDGNPGSVAVRQTQEGGA